MAEEVVATGGKPVCGQIKAHTLPLQCACCGEMMYVNMEASHSLRDGKIKVLHCPNEKDCQDCKESSEILSSVN